MGLEMALVPSGCETEYEAGRIVEVASIPCDFSGIERVRHVPEEYRCGCRRRNEIRSATVDPTVRNEWRHPIQGQNPLTARH